MTEETNYSDGEAKEITLSSSETITTIRTEDTDKTAEISLRTFDIDYDNICTNGDCVFAIKDVKSFIRNTQQQQGTGSLVHLVIANFVGSNIGLPFADPETRDQAYDELVKRWRFIQNGTIGAYIQNKKKEQKASAA
jgi:hypothetical protein